jgi:hypothetical protein
LALTLNNCTLASQIPDLCRQAERMLEQLGTPLILMLKPNKFAALIKKLDANKNMPSDCWDLTMRQIVFVIK